MGNKIIGNGPEHNVLTFEIYKNKISQFTKESNAQFINFPRSNLLVSVNSTGKIFYLRIKTLRDQISSTKKKNLLMFGFDDKEHSSNAKAIREREIKIFWAKVPSQQAHQPSHRLSHHNQKSTDIHCVQYNRVLGPNFYFYSFKRFCLSPKTRKKERILPETKQLCFCFCNTFIQAVNIYLFSQESLLFSYGFSLLLPS